MQQSAKHPLINLEQAFTYPEYEALIDRLLAENKTTGPDQDPKMVSYTQLNQVRMVRVARTTVLLPEVQQALADLTRSLQWVVLTEAWCGDAAQNVPILAKVANASAGKIELKLLLRDENLDLMDQYLTNGTRSIPKLICFDAVSGEELGTWGPRPDAAQALFQAFKENPTGTKKEFIQNVQLWYAKDKTISMQQEIAQLLKNWR
ncbi:thioredoxin family protein [Adhaeribacter radiodurans]|uniref:Thioredoxin family protein n=1 Tax=Adhaeribacter radiodurans TaxID=2745197 RepID=A0A7L7LEE5_9BACT|nr:thioredoxin family protein [Adhaeribacter radiodurans]QMU31143.1 thioredoxin family protein [Adhaeribacter radiodurans]